MIEDLEYRKIRYKFLKLFPRPYECMLCGIKTNEIHVDHIKPRSVYPELSCSPLNLQLLCPDCNIGKLNDYDDDFRSIEQIEIIKKEFYNKNCTEVYYKSLVKKKVRVISKQKQRELKNKIKKNNKSPTRKKKRRHPKKAKPSKGIKFKSNNTNPVILRKAK